MKFNRRKKTHTHSISQNAFFGSPSKARRKEQRRLKAQSLTAMLPNITTLMALCCGMTAIRFALMSKWEYAIISMCIAAILDTLDGRLARLLNSTSRFGAELDSFSDFLSFGAAPSIIMYLRSLNQWGEIGWAVSLFFTISMALRLARFNVMSVDASLPSWKLNFFTGMPAPIGGFFGLFPLILSAAFPYFEGFYSPLSCSLFMIGSSLLMVSRIPTFSLKKLVISPGLVLPFLLSLFIAIGLLYSYPWQTLSLIGVAYLITIPFSIKAFSVLEAQHNDTSKTASLENKTEPNS